MKSFFTCSRYAAVLISALLLTSSVRDSYAGGIEHYCNGTMELKERWLNPTNIPWEVRYLSCNSHAYMIPGYPLMACTLAKISGAYDFDSYVQLGGNLYDIPGLQSLIFAASSWKNAAIPMSLEPGNPGAGGRTVTLSSSAMSANGPIPLKPKSPIGGNFYAGVNVTNFSMAQPAMSSYDATFSSVWPNFCQLISLGNPVVPTDGVNSITFMENNLGSPFALAATFVRVDIPTGLIQEADILFSPFYSWTEYNYDSQSFYASSTGTNPQYASIEGVAAHEFGHLAGLGHSLHDAKSDSADSLFPTMFPFAQYEPVPAKISNNPVNPPLPYCSSSTLTIAPAGLELGGSAKTLEFDDMAAIGQAYPNGKFATKLGAIQGTVWQKLPNGSTAPAPGASVVAVHSKSSEKVRIGTLSYSSGNYSLEGLPEGEYFVYVEPVDQGPAGSGAYFPNDVTVPNFVFQGQSGCPGIVTGFPIEFFDENEAYEETSFSKATPVTVSAGVVVTGKDFKVKPSGPKDLLKIGVQGGPYSARGVRVDSTVTGSVELSIQDPSKAGQPVIVFISFERDSDLVVGSLFQTAFTPTSFPTSGVMSPTGTYKLLIPTPVNKYRNVFVQALVGAGANAVLSNSVNAWIFQ